VTELLSNWCEGLARARQKAFGHLASVLGTTEIDAGTWEELEALLIQADLGATTTQDVVRLG